MNKKDNEMSSVLNRFEKARIIGARALQLSMGAPPLMETPSAINAVNLATFEFEKSIIPLKVVRNPQIMAN